MPDAYNLDRFVRAQDQVYDAVCRELRSGRKQSHWMWFVFPQIIGLGLSEMSRRYAISSLGEARGYLEHPALGSRLRETTGLVNNVTGSTAHRIFGSPDDQKFHSSMTLFSQAAPDDPVFSTALAKYFQDRPDPHTVDKLR